MTVYVAQFTFHFGHTSSKRNISSFGKNNELSEIKHIKSKSKTYPLIQSRCIRGLTNLTQPCQTTYYHVTSVANDPPVANLKRLDLITTFPSSFLPKKNTVSKVASIDIRSREKKKIC